MDWGGSSEGGIGVDDREERTTEQWRKRNAFATVIDTQHLLAAKMLCHAMLCCALPEPRQGKERRGSDETNAVLIVVGRR